VNILCQGLYYQAVFDQGGKEATGIHCEETGIWATVDKHAPKTAGAVRYHCIQEKLSGCVALTLETTAGEIVQEFSRTLNRFAQRASQSRPPRSSSLFVSKREKAHVPGAYTIVLY